MPKKPSELSSSLVVVKGNAAASPDAIGRQTEELPSTPGVASLNFKVSPDFRQRFRKRALEADLKLNELLIEALDAWEKGRG